MLKGRAHKGCLLFATIQNLQKQDDVISFNQNYIQSLTVEKYDHMTIFTSYY